MEKSRKLQTTRLLTLDQADRERAKLIKEVELCSHHTDYQQRVFWLSSFGSENDVLCRLGLMQRHVRPPVMSSKYKAVILVRKSAVERRPVVNPGASDANTAN